MSVVAAPRTSRSGWSGPPDPAPCVALTGDVRADVLVVGAGLAGLSAAYHLSAARPELDVVVVDAHRVGSGATGRSTGIVRPGVAGTVVQLCRRFGDDEAARLYRLTVDAVTLVRDVVREEGIVCDLEPVPHLKLALTGGQERSLLREADTLRRLGLGCELFDGAALDAVSPRPARLGLCYPETVQLDPLALVRGLKRVLLARGVRVFEDSPVRALSAGPVRAETAGGTVRAGHVVVAANGYSASLGTLAGQVLPLHTHVAATAPLTPDQLARLSWRGRRSFSDRREVFDYCRLTRDGRIVFGGGTPLYRRDRSDPRAGATDLADTGTWRAQRRAFERTFPALLDVPFVDQWSGVMGMTLDHLPVVGRWPDRSDVTVCAGWNGHGLAMSMASGAVVRDLVLDVQAPRLPWLRSRAPQLPRDPARGLGLGAYLTALQVADRVRGRPAVDRLVSGLAGSLPASSTVAVPADRRVRS